MVRSNQNTIVIRSNLNYFVHPSVIAAVAFLILNDHFLKAKFGNWWTGKISDFAGLFFAPLFICALMQLVSGQVDWQSPARQSLTPRMFWLSLVAVDLGFVLLKTNSLVLYFYENLYARFGFSVRVIQDPTDLWALLVSGLTYLHAKPFLKQHQG